MATKQTKSTKSATTTTTTTGNPFAALAAPAAPAAPVKVHTLTAGNATLTAAHHVATFKGARPVAVGGTTYQLTGLAYNPNASHVNAMQWQAVQAAFTANDGNPVTVAQVAAQFTALGLAAGLANGFMAYRCKGGKPNLAPVKA